jgi:hypothetical protein
MFAMYYLLVSSSVTSVNKISSLQALKAASCYTIKGLISYPYLKIISITRECCIDSLRIEMNAI